MRRLPITYIRTKVRREQEREMIYVLRIIGPDDAYMGAARNGAQDRNTLYFRLAKPTAFWSNENTE